MQIFDIANFGHFVFGALFQRTPVTQIDSERHEKKLHIYNDIATNPQNLVKIGSADQKFTLWQEKCIKWVNKTKRQQNDNNDNNANNNNKYQANK